MSKNNGVIVKVVAGTLMLLVSYLVGQSTLGTRVTILETNYTHIIKAVDEMHIKLDRVLEDK